jgi:hypothetical protein
MLDLKRASHIHHPSIKEAQKTDNLEYSIKYVSSPKKSYLVSPKDGEIDYELAYKNRAKFYNKVLS